LALVQEAGHADFRDARGPLGFNQRQAAGRFTSDEVAEVIERLENAADDAEATSPQPGTSRRLSALEQALRAMPSEQLAAELQRRGWMVLEPLRAATDEGVSAAEGESSPS
jgi:hypothetical protein